MQDNRPRWADNFAATLIVTPVLPATATTGVLLFPEHVTVALLGGAVLLHCAVAGDAKTASRSSRTVAVVVPLAIVPTVVSAHPRNRTTDLNGFWEPICCLENGASKLLSLFNPRSFLMQKLAVNARSAYGRPFDGRRFNLPGESWNL
jgi:hypothetical protein